MNIPGKQKSKSKSCGALRYNKEASAGVGVAEPLSKEKNGGVKSEHREPD